MEYLAQQSNNLAEERGILSLRGSSRGLSLQPETVVIVCSLYKSDDISHLMPGFHIGEERETSAYSKVTGSERSERGVP